MNYLNELDYDLLEINLDIIFPHFPFCIKCVSDLEQLKYIFTLEESILIKDTIDGVSNYLTVFKVNNQQITIEQVIDQMGNSPYYCNILTNTSNYRFLEGFRKITNNIFEPLFSNV